MQAATYFQRELEGSANVAREAKQLSGSLARLADMMRNALRVGCKVMFAGNGGSAAEAQHMAAEYVVRFAHDRRAIPALSLTTDTSLITACANDYDFNQIFARQVEALGQKGDVLLLYSTSGQSPNLIEAARVAHRKGMLTAALLAKGGGQLKDEVGLAIVVPTDNTARAQEAHMAMGHALVGWLEQELLLPST